MLKKKRTLILAISFLIAATLFTRFNKFWQPINTENFQRDLLVARHINEHEEFPLTGPTTKIFGKIKYPPSYFYFLSLLTSISDKHSALFFFDAIFQIISLVFVWLIAKNLFDKRVAFLSSVIFTLGFSQINFLEFQNIYQPWIMQAIITPAYFLLFLGLDKKKRKYIFYSLLLFSLAVSFHFSPLGILIPVFLWIFLYSKGFRKPRKLLRNSLAIFSFPFLLLFSPLFMFALKEEGYLGQILSSIGGVLSMSSFLSIPNKLNVLTNMVSLDPHTLNLLFPAIFIFLVFFYFYTQQNRGRKVASFIIFSFISFQILILSLISPASIRINSLWRYFMPVFGLFIVFISEAIINLLTKLDKLRWFGYLFIAIYLCLWFLDLNQSFLPHIRFENKKISISPLSSINPDFSRKASFVPVMANRIREVQKENGFENYNFFQIVSYYNSEGIPWKKSILWNPLEKELDSKFTKLSDSNPDGYVTTNSDDYLFLICARHQDFKEESCKLTFNKNHPKYRILEKITDDPHFLIFFAKKET